MGVDLRILPAYNGDADFSVTSLECHRDSNLFDVIQEIQKEHGRDVSRKGFSGYMGDTFAKRDTDAYGKVLQSIQAKHLKEVTLFSGNPTNRAILSYVKELDNDHELFLYWH